MKVINLFGGPGSGKSSTAAGLFYEMKKRHLNTELVIEFAKDLVYSENFKPLQHNQEYIFAEQHRRQQILEGKVDWCITDAPLLVSMYYGKKGKFNQEAFFNLVSDTFRQYENENFFLLRPEVFQEVGRVHNLEQSQEIDYQLTKILDDENVKFTFVKTDEDTVQTILKLLM